MSSLLVPKSLLNNKGHCNGGLGVSVSSIIVLLVKIVPLMILDSFSEFLETNTLTAPIMVFQCYLCFLINLHVKTDKQPDFQNGVLYYN